MFSLTITLCQGNVLDQNRRAKESKVDRRSAELRKMVYTPEKRWDSWGDPPNTGRRTPRRRTLEEIDRTLK